MNQDILDYLKTQRVGVLAVELLDGSPHGATVHFAITDDPLVFYFETHSDTIKAKALFGREKSRASFVVGTEEGKMKTMQLDGEVELLKPEEQEKFDQVYLGKFGEKKDKVKDPKIIAFKFTPHWWRFTDWTNKEDKKILLSDSINN